MSKHVLQEDTNIDFAVLRRIIFKTAYLKPPLFAGTALLAP